MIVVLMGVSGSGKTTVGKKLAAALECSFLDGDSLHPAANISKMSRGIPLTDADREPWLSAIHQHILESWERGDDLVVGCSALKDSYRRVIDRDLPVVWVYLKGSAALISERIKLRSNHFMKADMLASQFADLEEPNDALTVDISETPDQIVEIILTHLRKHASRGMEDGV